MLRALLFILTSGNAASRLRNLLFYAVMRLRHPDCAAVWDSCFDASAYAEDHPEAAASGLPAWLHFLVEGYRAGFNPSPSFHSRYYLYRHPDVARSGLNPLLHYALHGWKERRPTAAAPGFRADGSRIPPLQREEWRSAVEMPPPRGPLVSVVIPCFNYGRYLDEALQSVERQTLSGVEIVVVEGGSTDGETPALVRELDAAYGDRVKFLYRDRPCPVADNRNFGIGHAEGSLISCLDADDLLRPTFLEVAAFAALAGHYDLVSPSLEMFGESTGCWLVGDATFPEIVEANQVATCALFRKNAWAAAGGYRDFGSGEDHIPEDWDLWVRMLAGGARSLGMRRTLLRYRVHSHGISAESKAAQPRFRGRIREANRELLARPPRPLPPPPGNDPADVRRVLDHPGGQPAILLALPFVTVGGAEKLLASLVRRWMDLGYRVLVISTTLLGPSMPDHSDLIESITPHYYPLPDLFGMESPLWADFLEFLILRYKVETLLITGSEYTYTQLPGLRQQFPELLVADQLFNHEGHMASNRFYADSIDLTVVPTPWLANFIMEQHGERPERIAVIPHSIEPEPVRAAGDDLLPGSFAGKPVVGFFGRFSPEKGPLEFIEIAARVAKRSGAMFLMAGEGPMRPRVEELIRKRGLEKRIHLPGMLAAEKVSSAMARCDVVVTPSILDGMPLAIFEAQAQARTVVASRVGSIPAMIEDGVTGWLCEPGDVDSFASRILAALEGTALRERIGKAARAAVEQREGTLGMAQTYLDAFRAARERRGSDVLPK